ncbi:MAG: penicillin-binding protein [Blastocatellia bacterium]|nr:penicillin-binding protein [Blastocatellia bacterium]
MSLGLALVLMTLAGFLFLLSSYRYYSNIVDARLARGYLTSRAGIYAAPRTLRAGQRLSADALLAQLRRSGYVETSASDAWSGSFTVESGAINIRPNKNSSGFPSLVRVTFDTGGRLAELSSDGITLSSFTLEPEALTNDLTMKTGKHATLSYAEIPPLLVQAILSIEDRRFAEHSGVDFFGVARAMLRNAGDERMGQGGSTITQQLVKNTYLTPERTLRRKFAEAMLAFTLERRFSKQDIFALYCNEIYLGQRNGAGVRGVNQAARVFFAKELKDLSLSEAATIAGLIQSPARYSPVHYNEAARLRRNTVLGTMVRDGVITLEQAAAAAKEPVVISPLADVGESMAPFFVDYVNRETGKQDPNPVARPATAGPVFTTLDMDLQQSAEAAIKRQLETLDTLYQARGARPQAALVAMDPKTGNVLAMVGGRNYSESQLNRATDARRQPGSVFKPMVYAAALESGLSPLMSFSDAPREFAYDHKAVYRPANYGGSYSMRSVPMRAGLVQSLNVVTVDVATRVGLSQVADLAASFGLPRPAAYPALALGTTEVTPLEIATAYAAFANGGHRIQPNMLVGVSEGAGGHDLRNSLPVASFAADSQIIQPETAYMITDMLADVIDHGTGRAARGLMKETAIAGKTGTSRDGWFVGYTPNLVCAVWIGFDDNQQLGLTGAEAALPVWVEFMKGAIAMRPELGGDAFTRPEAIRILDIDPETGMLASGACPHRERIAISASLMPSAECYRHHSYSDCPEAPEGAMVSENSDPVIANHRRSAQSSKSTAGGSGGAGQLSRAMSVEIDRLGRRTLTNEMR